MPSLWNLVCLSHLEAVHLNSDCNISNAQSPHVASDDRTGQCSSWASLWVSCLNTDMYQYRENSLKRMRGALLRLYGGLTERWPHHNSRQGCVRRGSFHLQSHVPGTEIRATKTRDFFWCELYFQFFLHLDACQRLSRTICMGVQSDSLQMTIRKKSRRLTVSQVDRIGQMS